MENAKNVLLVPLVTTAPHNALKTIMADFAVKLATVPGTMSVTHLKAAFLILML